MALVEDKSYTVEDIYALPEGQRAEIFDGQLYMMAPPTSRHQEIVADLVGEFHSFMKEKKKECKVYPAPFAVFLSETDNYVEPDLSIICNKDKVDSKGCHGAPDLVIEVVSPSSERMDYMIKLFKYRTAKVREYWIVDERKNRITVYNFEKDEVQEYSFSDKIPVGICEGELEVDFGTL